MQNTTPATTAPAAPKQDNLLGVCAAIGQAIGINPLYLRLVLAIMFILNFQVALIAYTLGGLVVLSERAIAFVMRRRARQSARRAIAYA